MALNLWTLGGQPISYKPLPQGYVNSARLAIGDFIIKFKAKAGKNNVRLYVFGNGATSSVNGTTVSSVILDVQEKEYEVTIKNPISGNLFYLYDIDGVGSIEISGVQLTEKPLGAATINGIDGFASGKWGLHANAKVIDDETLELNATATNQFSEIEYPVLPNTEYTAKVEISDVLGKFDIRYDGSYKFTSRGLLTFKTDSNTKVVKISLARDGVGLVTFKRPMLNLGSTPAPYSKKTGTRMVKPEARKNLLQSELKYDTPVQAKLINGSKHVFRAKEITNKPGWRWFIKFFRNGLNVTPEIPLSKVSLGVYLAGNTHFQSASDTNVLTFTIDSVNADTVEIYYRFGTGATTPETSRAIDAQLEEGTTATPYEPYAVQQNAKPRKAVQAAPKGLAFDGVRDYLQLPSMTMDSVELDCLIGSAQKSSTPYIVDARNGLALGFAYVGSIAQGVITHGAGLISATGFKANERSKISFAAAVPFTDNVNIFSRFEAFNGDPQTLNGTLYGVKCYLKGQLVAAYDFTQPGAVVGDKVLPAPQNLIPPFDDKRWSLHPNFRVLGRDVGRLESTAASQSTRIDRLNVKPSKKYLFDFDTVTAGAEIVIAEFAEGGAVTRSNTVVNKRTEITTFPTTAYIYILLRNTVPVGAFTFIKPQLYELPATAGTLFGSPRVNDKPARRTLYAKR